MVRRVFWRGCHWRRVSATAPSSLPRRTQPPFRPQAAIRQFLPRLSPACRAPPRGRGRLLLLRLRCCNKRAGAHRGVARNLVLEGLGRNHRNLLAHTLVGLEVLGQASVVPAATRAEAGELVRLTPAMRGAASAAARLGAAHFSMMTRAARFTVLVRTPCATTTGGESAGERCSREAPSVVVRARRAGAIATAPAAARHHAVQPRKADERAEGESGRPSP